MVNTTGILIVSGILVFAGIVISYYLSETEISDIAMSQQTITSGSYMNVSKGLDPAKSTAGVWSVKISGFKEGDTVKASLIDPVGSTVLTEDLDKSPVQQNFTVSSNGTYMLKIQNSAKGDLQILGIIGYYPQGPGLLDLVSIIVLIVGLSGLAIGMMYFLRGRGKIGR